MVLKPSPAIGAGTNYIVFAPSRCCDVGSADCSPAFIGLCQDIQESAFDYP
ncbi:MAG: hypothetical protein OSA23_00300 [Rhodospirillales bacterium]|nr:hypothetical protein [Rhodospirillales bacterium]